MKFGVRIDPILKGKPIDLGDDRYDPDRPGVLPVMKLDETFNPEHPYYAKIKEKLASTLKKIAEKIVNEKTKDAKPSEEERLKLVEQEQVKLANQISTLYPKHRYEFDSGLDSLLRNPAAIDAEDRLKLEERWTRCSAHRPSRSSTLNLRETVPKRSAN